MEDVFKGVYRAEYLCLIETTELVGRNKSDVNRKLQAFFAKHIRMVYYLKRAVTDVANSFLEFLGSSTDDYVKE